MIIIPYNTELRLSQRPYVVYAVIIICFIVFYFQQENRKAIEQPINAYCESIYAPDITHDNYDYMRGNKKFCSYFLQLLHERSDIEHWLELNVKLFSDQFTLEELKKYAVYEIQHYRKLIKNYTLPESLDNKLMYYPESLNPFKMLTSAVSHADWSHIIFNLIFFFAFAPALEVLAGSKLKFIGVLVAIEIIGGITYSIVSLLNGTNIPTLGLSGSVVGMIGFSAYMMPWARINTLFVFTTYARKFSIPAWYLAAWFIGWDVYELFSRTNNGGVNVLAHVAGGLSGYFLGVLFFKQNKEDAEHELAVEIDYMQSKRNTFSGLAGTFKGDSLYVDSKLREHDAKKEFGKYTEALYHFVKSGKTAEAIVHIIDKYDLYEKSPEIYEDLFHEVGEWKKKRVYLCLGGLVIHLYIEQKKLGKVPVIVKACLSVDDDFVLANPDNLLLVVNELISMHQTMTAYSLVKDAKTKYGEYINSCDCLIMEAKILWQHLDKETEAKSLLEQAMTTASQNEKKKMTNLLSLIGGI